jgi:endonuclease-3
VALDEKKKLAPLGEKKGRATLDERKRLAAWYARRLAALYPDPRIPLDFKTPLDLYVATVLSAQCTDARVNQVTPALFALCRTPEDYLSLGTEKLEKMVQSTGFFRNKTRSILGGCARMVEAFGGEVPDTMEDLLTVPGVGRKTANVILGSFGKNEGIVVDTHVKRVAARLGLTSQDDPVKIEQDLITLVPRNAWTDFALRVIFHGRRVCFARFPQCPACPLLEKCPDGRQALAEGIEKGEHGKKGAASKKKTKTVRKRT